MTTAAPEFFAVKLTGIGRFQAAKLGTVRRTLLLVLFAALCVALWALNRPAPTATPAPVVHNVVVTSVRPVGCNTCPWVTVSQVRQP